MKKSIKTAVWLAVIALWWFGIYKFISYKIDMYYSILAAKQFENDSAYGELKFHTTANMITYIFFIVVTLLILYRIIKIWSTDKEKVE